MQRKFVCLTIQALGDKNQEQILPHPLQMMRGELGIPPPMELAQAQLELVEMFGAIVV
jgi:hypothetical protein